MVLVDNDNTEQQTLQQHFSKFHCVFNHRNFYGPLIRVKMMVNKIWDSYCLRNSSGGGLWFLISQYN